MAKTLTTEQWIEILKNSEITKELGLKIFQTLLEFDDYKAYASEIGLKLGYKKSPQSPLNLEIGRYGKRIAKYYDVDLTIRENSKYKFWDIFFVGEDVGTMFLWKLRPELANALLSLGDLRTTNPQKVARICWNYYNWTKPSGKEGKSLNKTSYEYETGFGHEEWLFDFQKQINGYHYAFLQPINANWEKYIGKIFDINLYSIDNSTKERWWLGKIRNAEIISREEANDTFKTYTKNGWIKEMIEQLKVVDADYKKLISSDYDLFNIKFTKSDCDELLDIPLLLSETDNSIKATYYTTLLNKELDPVFENVGVFKFTAKHNPQKRNTVATYGQRLSEIDKLHPKIQDLCYEQLVKEFGKQNVGTEIQTGYGTSIDLAVNQNGEFSFYEIKTNISIRICVREAISQLLEYAHFPNKTNANKLVIVSQNTIDTDTKNYLKNLREVYRLPIHYRQFDLEKNFLTTEEY
jgi:hypothetical protein